MSSNRRLIRSGEQGFTLVELLAAMVGSALLLAALATMTGTLGTRLRGPATAPDLLAAQTALSALAERIVPSEAGDRPSSTPSRLALSLLPPEASGSAQAISASLLVTRAGDRAALVLQPESNRDGATDQMITSGWRRIDLRPLWRLPSPADPGAPPLLAGIALDLVAPDGSEHQLAAATRIDIGAACHFDPISQSCRP